MSSQDLTTFENTMDGGYAERGFAYPMAEAADNLYADHINNDSLFEDDESRSVVGGHQGSSDPQFSSPVGSDAQAFDAALQRGSPEQGVSRRSFSQASSLDEDESHRHMGGSRDAAEGKSRRYASSSRGMAEDESRMGGSQMPPPSAPLKKSLFTGTTGNSLAKSSGMAATSRSTGSKASLSRRQNQPSRSRSPMSPAAPRQSPENEFSDAGDDPGTRDSRSIAETEGPMFVPQNPGYDQYVGDLHEKSGRQSAKKINNKGKAVARVPANKVDPRKKKGVTAKLRCGEYQGLDAEVNWKIFEYRIDMKLSFIQIADRLNKERVHRTHEGMMTTTWKSENANNRFNTHSKDIFAHRFLTTARHKHLKEAETAGLYDALSPDERKLLVITCKYFMTEKKDSYIAKTFQLAQDKAEKKAKKGKQPEPVILADVMSAFDADHTWQFCLEECGRSFHRYKCELPDMTASQLRGLFVHIENENWKNDTFLNDGRYIAGRSVASVGEHSLSDVEDQDDSDSEDSYHQASIPDPYQERLDESTRRRQESVDRFVEQEVEEVVGRYDQEQAQAQAISDLRRQKKQGKKAEKAEAETQIRRDEESRTFNRRGHYYDEEDEELVERPRKRARVDIPGRPCSRPQQQAPPPLPHPRSRPQQRAPPLSPPRRSQFRPQQMAPPPYPSVRRGNPQHQDQYNDQYNGQHYGAPPPLAPPHRGNPQHQDQYNDQYNGQHYNNAPCSRRNYDDATPNYNHRR